MNLEARTPSGCEYFTKTITILEELSKFNTIAIGYLLIADG
jgi:hypothetical protein